MSFLISYGPCAHESHLHHFDGAQKTKLGCSGEAWSIIVDKPWERQGQVSVTFQDGFHLIGRLRLDNKQNLRTTLGAHFDDTESQLCLRAFARWGEECLQYLSGDFAFVIWNDARRTIFCARDQLGVKALFYTRIKELLLVSDELDDLVHVLGSAELDDFWIADYLTSGFCIDADRTVYRNIKRLSPAHYLIARRELQIVRRYWNLRLESPIFHRDENSYLEQFRELVGQAIRDRVSTDKIGISLSGGLDSSTLAAATLKIIGNPSRVVAHTTYCESLVPDEEKQFSQLVTQQLGIPHILYRMDHGYYDPKWYTQEVTMPEPSVNVISFSTIHSMHEQMAESASIWFEGEGPDNALLFEWRAYLRWLGRQNHGFELGRALYNYCKFKHKNEWITTFRSLWGRARIKGDQPVPSWLNPEIVQNTSLKDRVIRIRDTRPYALTFHPQALASFNSSIWQTYLQQFDPAWSGVALNWRHPYLDLRVLHFLLSVPPIPWARGKLIIRRSMRDVLPAEILRRRKTPLSGNPVGVLMRRSPMPDLPYAEQTRKYVLSERVPTVPQSIGDTDAILRVRTLDHWIRVRRRSRG